MAKFYRRSSDPFLFVSAMLKDWLALTVLAVLEARLGLGVFLSLVLRLRAAFLELSR